LNKSNIIKYGLFAVVGALIIYSIYNSFDYNAFKTNIQNANVFYIILSVSGGVVAVLLRALRWQLILKPMGYNPSLSNAYHSTMSGYLVNLGIPRTGEVYRCAVLAKTENIPVNVLVGTVVSERILDLIMLVLVITSSVLLQFDLLYGFIYDNLLIKLIQNKILLSIVLGVFVLGIIFLLKNKSLWKSEGKIANIFKGFANGLKSVFNLEKPFLFTVYTLGIWICYWIMTTFVLLAFDYTNSLGGVGGLCVLVFSSLGVIIPAPGGIATIKSVEIGLSQIFKFTISQANAVGMVLFFSNFLMIILAGSISFGIMAFRTKV